ncbi:MAG: hypothetical protein ACE5KZ_00130 [Candidatus Scalinduaceae bacterium]
MLKKVRCAEFRTGSGNLIFSVDIFDKEVVQENESNASTGHKQEVREKKGQNNNQNNGDLMTDAQKRYLFRLLADQGFEEDKAHDRLKELLHVDSLKEVTKSEASKMIERLLEESKGGEDDRPPF